MLGIALTIDGTSELATALGIQSPRFTTCIRDIEGLFPRRGFLEMLWINAMANVAGMVGRLTRIERPAQFTLKGINMSATSAPMHQYSPITELVQRILPEMAASGWV
jgi:hypothetical protein